MRRFFPYIFIILFCIITNIVKADINNRIFPAINYVENIPSSEYLGDVQVWDIKSGPDEVIYAATARGLSVFDGVRWRNFTTANLALFRCLYYDTIEKRLYAAADNEFGYWEVDKYGQYIYNRIYSNQNKEISDIFWRILGEGDNVYFQTHDKVYLFDKADQKVRLFFSHDDIHYMHKLREEICIQAGKNLWKKSDETFIDTQIVVPDRIVGMYPHKEGFIIITQDKGLMTLKDGIVESIHSDVSRKLSNASVFSSAQLNDSTYLLGTVLGGLFIMDDNMKIINQINFESGLNHTTVLSVNSNLSGDIWLGLDGGMACIRHAPHEIILENKNDDIGSIYDGVWFNGNLYVATNKGLYIYENNTETRFITNSQGQIWNLVIAGNHMYVCHDKGLFVLNEGILKAVSPKRVWQLKSLGNNSPYYISMDFEGGFSLYKVSPEGLKFEKKISGFSGLNTDAGIDRFGQIWVQDRFTNPVRIKLDNYNNIETIQKYDLPEFVNTLWRADIDNDVVFFENKTAYTYDISRNELIVNEHYSKLLENMLFEPMHITQSGDNFFYISRQKAGYIKRYNNSFYNFGEIFQSLNNYGVPTMARRFIKIDNNITGMGLQNGIALYLTYNSELTSYNKKELEISQITLNSQGIETLLPVSNDAEIPVPYKYSDIQIYFKGLYEHRQILYSIDNGEWKLVKGAPYFRLPHLDSGHYSIRFRNMEPDFSELNVINIQINIDKPWYQSTCFYIALLIFFIACILLIRKLFKYRMQVQQEIIIKKQKKILENEKKEYELRLLKLQLKKEEKQLVNLTMESIKRNSMLKEIRNDVTNLSAENNEGGIKNKIKMLVKKIDHHLRDRETHELFEKYFNAIHDGFLDRLLKKHPDLTQNELRLCAYIKLNFDSKEIAVYTNISPNSVTIARHRLRRKLNLNQEVSLQKYISEI